MPIILKKSFNTKNNLPIYYLEGDTYPIRNKLGRYGLGFTWYGARKMWWIYADKLNPAKKEGLRNLGVDISVLEDVPASVEPTVPEPIPPESSTEITQELTNKTETDSGKYFKDVKDSLGAGYDTIPGRYGFPIKANIYSTDITVKVDETEVPLTVTMDRWYRKARRKIPSYHYNVIYNGNKIWEIAIQAKGGWGTYDEDQLAREIPEKIQTLVDQKKKLYHSILQQLELDQRDPDLTKFLKEWDDYPGFERKGEQDFLAPYLTPKTITVSEPNYEGNYPIALHKVFDAIHLDTIIEHPLAPHSIILDSIGIPPEIRNIE